ncbi:SprT-like family protein [Candidatus Palauibacter sp.]|uniref:SprT-like family protein n=1 Tax=Candidatus Palauibacter sp. TaxID=3101350 RepID=UPI003B0158F4
MPTDALSRLLRTRDPGEIAVRAWTDQIGSDLLNRSSHLREPNFTEIGRDDLASLFSAYDGRFLDGLCGRILGPDSLAFRLSRRMTRAGGKTTCFDGRGGAPRFEIAIATSILFDGFGEDDRDVTVGGLPCRNRLEALQRIFEHELVHLAEFLCWGESHCGRSRFQGIATRLFLHRAHTHHLVTRSERAARDGIVVGSRAAFDFRGQVLTGRVNRITKRATVLVEDARGQRWSDGRRYQRYYVPLGKLQTVHPAPGRKPESAPGEPEERRKRG